MGRDYRPGEYGRIEANVEGFLKTLAIPGSSVLVWREPNEHQRFVTSSWTLREYEQAVKNDEFLGHVQSKLTDSIGDVDLEGRMELVRTKVFVAGGSARLMFGMRPEDAKTYLRWAIVRATDFTQYLVDGETPICLASVCFKDLTL
ncbi:unnamed protein product [Phytophthora lilii]|uniref:Unnamed protein product n=1 Tax=Phytophthora lilii TaxID=2077276 RepID=A0A9W6U5I3_9STRA|nr:unnamed protein product [Phytophthora lilii]